jgi:hypothetical protein
MAAARRASCAPFRARAAQGSVVAWAAGLACSGWLAHRCHGVLFFEHHGGYSGPGPGAGTWEPRCRVLPLLALLSIRARTPARRVASRLRGTSRRGAGAGARVRCDRFHLPNLKPQLGEGLRIYTAPDDVCVSVSSDVFRLPKQAFKISHQPLLRVLSIFFSI